MTKKYRVLAVAVLSLIALIMGAGNSWAAATYSSTTGALHIPAVDIQGSGAYDVDLLFSGSNPGGFQVNMEFVLQGGTLAEANTIRIGNHGTQTKTYIAGISEATTEGPGIAVFIDANGQLGTISSSRRFKEEIKDMGEASSDLMKLRPVTFMYKPEIATGERILQYGLIAEEVAEVYPDLVQYSAAGEANTVYYHLVNAMLLNEVQKQNRQIADLQERLSRIEALINNR